MLKWMIDVFRWPHFFQQGASLVQLDGLRVCIGVTAGCMVLVTFQSEACSRPM